MKYIAAVIKETLRLHPPAATARTTKHGTGFTVRAPDGQQHCLDGMIIYNCETLIHRDPDIYGDTANSFVPERWIGQDDEQSTSDLSPNQIPLSSWRPFERGPRNCIGQEFANIELRVIIAVVARRYDFVKVGLGEVETDDRQLPVTTEDGRFKVKSELYNVSNGLSPPNNRPYTNTCTIDKTSQY
ncbi:hypothetical protein PC116_g31384 [Phytophthora cactorum]|nr:hypothetical protein PC116_g31384 [Phytophthora cactorum]